MASAHLPARHQEHAAGDGQWRGAHRREVPVAERLY